MKTKIKIAKKIYEVDISEKKNGLINVEIDGEEFNFLENESGEIIPCDKERIIDEKEGTASFCPVSVEKEIRSPITGAVSEIFIKESERINVGQKILTIISMKMENEIISENCGKVKKIKVKKDQFVNTGDILINLE